MKQPSETLIDIKLCEQDELKNDCVPSCVKSVIDTLSPNNKISKIKICKLMKHSVKRGTPLENCINLNRFLSSKSVGLSFTTPEKIESKLIEWQNIKEKIVSGFPVICLVNREALIDRERRGDNNLHAIIVAGFDTNTIKYFDPLILNSSSEESVTQHKFNVAWKSAYKGVLFVGKEEQARL